jgi:Zn-finger nucleic acid-binding protein
MKCPDCAGPLVEITLTGIDKTWRCFRCGGVWMRSNTADELPIGALEGWKPIEFDETILLAGDNHCPVDGGNLMSYESQGVSREWNVRQCQRCRSWWWPADTLFRLKRVAGDVGNYTRISRVLRNLGVAMAVVVTGLILGGGLITGMGLVKARQKVLVPAEGDVADFSAAYIGGGVAVLAFRSEVRLESIRVRQFGVGEWQSAKLDLAGDQYISRITGLEEGEKFEVKIGQEIFIFETVKK